MVMLDATAGNRRMWRGKNLHINNVVFMDREKKLRVPPDIFADYRCCPFRDGVFECVIFDPPFMSRLNPPIFWNDPEEKLYKDKKGFTGRNPFWGIQISKIELWSGIYKAQEEFKRLTNRLCLKWSEVDYSLWKVLPFFKDWIIIQKKGFKQPRHKKGYKTFLKASDDPRCKTWWITFVHSSGTSTRR